MTQDQMIAWLSECERYFTNKDTRGEDRAFWSNQYNAKNAKVIRIYLQELVFTTNGFLLALKECGYGKTSDKSLPAEISKLEMLLEKSKLKAFDKNDVLI